MEYQIRLNSKFYPIKPGFVFKPSANDKLDSGTIVLDTTEQLNIEPYDRIEVYQDDKRLYIQLVDNFMENIIQFEPFKRYEYTINLMSQTKILERITLPSLSITALEDAPVRKVSYYIRLYLDYYLPKVKVLLDMPPADSELVKYKQVPMFELDYKVMIRFGNIDCPEFSWNEPTLREVLDDLFKVDDCLCIVKDNVITLMDLRQEGKKIDNSKIIDCQRTMSAQDYVSDLTITMKNSIGKNLVNNCEYASLHSEGGEITTENSVLMTQFPIYNLKRVKACYCYTWQYIGPNSGEDKIVYGEVDITPLIVEQDQFNILIASDPTQVLPFDELKKYQKYNLYYKRGDNKIQNFGDTLFFASTFKNIITNCASQDPTIVAPGADYYMTSRDIEIRDIAFKIEYETLADRKMKVGKYLPNKNVVSEVFDNQTNSYVNVQQQSMFEYFKANRLGNEIKIITGIYKNIREVPKVYDNLDGAILFESEISYYQDYIMFKGYLTKNYLLDNYFTGIQSKRRSWAIAQGNEALTRYDVLKYYCQFSFHPKYEFIENFERIAEGEIIDYFVSPLIAYTASPIKHCLVVTYDGQGSFPKLISNAYELDFNTEIQGMSLCFNYGFSDNYQVGNYTFKDKKLYRNGIYPYCNNKGNFDAIRINLMDYVDPTGGKFTLPSQNQEVDKSMNDKIKEMAYVKPMIENVDFNYAQLRIKKDLFKDNREIIAQTIQLEFCSDTPNIIVGEAFLKWQKAISTNDNNLGFIYESTSETYNLQSKIPLGAINYDDYKVEVIPIENKPLEVNCVKIRFSRKDGGNLNIKSFALTSPFGEFMLGVNRPTDATNEVVFYLSILTNRDENVYDNNKNYNYAGKMWNVDYKIKVQ